MKALFAVLLLCLVTAPAFARLGETEAQMKGRYGDGSPNEDFQIHFSKNGWAIEATVHAGTCVKLNFAKEGLLTTRITEAEVSTLLEANQSGGPWKPNPSKDFKTWVSGDGLRVAEFYDSFLVIKDSMGFAAWQAAKDARDKVKLKAF